MDYISIKEASAKWGITERRIRTLCSDQRIPGAKNMGKQWMIPAEAPRPIDGRTKVGKKQVYDSEYHFPVLIFSTYYSRVAELDEDYRNLFDAQVLYLKGKHAESALLCRRTLDHNVSPAVRFGLYATLAYDSLLMGLNIEAHHYLGLMKNVVSKEDVHKEDYRLIMELFNFHLSWNPTEILHIDISSLSSEALPYYYSSIILAILVENNNETSNAIISFDIACKLFDFEGCVPLSILMHSILGKFYFVNNFGDKSKTHITQACKLALKNGFESYLAKFYYPSSSLYDEYLGEKDPQTLKHIQNLAVKNVSNWRIANRHTNAFVPYDNIDPKVSELLTLFCYDLSDADIAKLLRISEDEYDNLCQLLLDYLKMSDKDKLRESSKQYLSQVYNSNM